MYLLICIYNIWLDFVPFCHGGLCVALSSQKTTAVCRAISNKIMLIVFSNVLGNFTMMYVSMIMC